MSNMHSAVVKPIVNPFSAVKDSAIWQRPADWLTLPPVAAGDNKLVGLYAVFSDASNVVSFVFSNNYTVNWGDGSSVENYAAWALASHEYDYSAVSDQTLSSQGYKQVVITVVPQEGLTLLAVNLKGNPSPEDPRPYRTHHWLDIAIAGSEISGLWVASWSVKMPILERLVFHGPNEVTNLNECFSDCYAIQIIEMDTSKVTSMVGTFRYCFKLKELPDFQTSLVTDMNNIFYHCESLERFPSTWDLSSLTTMDAMFKYCYNLVEVSETALATLTAACLTAEAAFSLCKSLRRVILPSTMNPENLQYMCEDCNSLKTVQLPQIDNVSALTGCFDSNYRLTSLTVAAGKISCALSVQYANLSAEALVVIFNALADLSATTQSYINIQDTRGVGDLTVEQLAIATNKNWTITT